MENASKALLIAGAILIAILLISIGMMIFGNIGGFTDTATQQTDIMQVQMFNKQFEQYAGKNVSGSNVKALVSNIKANNNTYTNVDPSKVISLVMQSKTGGTITENDIGANYRYEVTFGTDDGSGFINSATIKQK